MSTIKAKILEEAVKLVPKYGFVEANLLPSTLDVLKAKGEYDNKENMANLNFVQLFPRGFPIAVVEYIVDNSNKVTHQRLEKCFNKSAIFSSIVENKELYRMGYYKPPDVKKVVEEAMLTKFNTLLPYVHHWPEAVALEWNPANVPFAIKNVAEFVDTTCYYAERMENLGTVIASGNVLLQSRVFSSFNPGVHLENKNIAHHNVSSSKTEEERFWESFSLGIPLSSSPQTSGGLVNCQWYAMRTKVAAVFSMGMLSFVGEAKMNHPETKAMVKRLTDTLL
ncbi:putative dynein heavy chain [Trypanosoma theileri]|uniref:Ubiquinone biosynthesis protein n=1 Tax=Trypanosoma theileri TaxID=67003 RepID=A0A1X0NP57_9TRYP|nr:putative dynein heavy chain [Trypanosoma theileri]ORC86273.1 putative dynein heavy chain [Trypanosoma theileri]